MDKRYQIFVSSTYEDLWEERQEIMQALLELDCIPAGMELFPAANEDQWSLIKKVIDDCDYYIVVIGGRYGSIGPTGISFTQMEYEYAVAQRKPVIAFLHKDPTSLIAKRVEKTEHGKQKLEAFRTVSQQRMCKFWTTPADLGSAVSRSLVKLIKNNPAVGWIKADLLPDKSTTEEILRLRQKIEELQSQLAETQSSSIIGAEQLSQGDDPIKLNYSFGAFKSSTWNPDKTYKHSYTTTWNTLFSAISPLLIDEASDISLKKSICSFIETSEIQNLQKKTEGFTLKKFELDEADFNTIKVQFLALGLITKSTKRKARSVSDGSAYWMLTTKGEGAMMILRAVRRPTASGAEGVRPKHVNILA